MPRTLEQIKKDFLSYKALAKKQDGVTLYAEKYVEDVGSLLQMLEPNRARVVEAEETKPEVRKSKAKTPKAE